MAGISPLSQIATVLCIIVEATMPLLCFVGDYSRRVRVENSFEFGNLLKGYLITDPIGNEDLKANRLFENILA